MPAARQPCRAPSHALGSGQGAGGEGGPPHSKEQECLCSWKVWCSHSAQLNPPSSFTTTLRRWCPLFPFCRGNRGKQRLSDLPRFTQPIESEAES